MLNSSAVVGLSIPALGTPERDTVRITLLDKMVSANLIYLDALAKGADKNPEYQRKMQRFTDAILADLYVRKQTVGDIDISEQEVRAFYDESIVPGAEMSDELRTMIEASIRKRKLEEKLAGLRDALREESNVKVFATELYPEGDAGRSDDTVIARSDTLSITWGEVKDRLIGAGQRAVKRNPIAMESDARLQALQAEIDTRLLAQKARAAGLEQDPSFLARYNEYQKTSLINLHRASLVREMAPSDEELKAYFEANRDRISTPEYRKVQMVMFDSEEEARSVKQRIESGEITMFQAASEYSVAPDAKQNLGEIGWIEKGKLKAELDATVFKLEPAEIGGPVKAGGLWHLVAVQDVKDAENTDISEDRTHKIARRTYIHEKMDEYVVKLRQEDFEVEVYQDVIVELAQKEADMVKQLAEKAREPDSVTRQRMEDMQKLMNP
jgi:parvulin-like peptidyl-prolyl isomerase